MLYFGHRKHRFFLIEDLFDQYNLPVVVVGVQEQLQDALFRAVLPLNVFLQLLVANLLITKYVS